MTKVRTGRNRTCDTFHNAPLMTIYIYIKYIIHIMWASMDYQNLGPPWLTQRYFTMLLCFFYFLSAQAALPHTFRPNCCSLAEITLGLMMSCGNLSSFRRCCKSLCPCHHVLGFQGHGTCHCEAEASPHHWLECCCMAEQLAIWIHSIWFRLRDAGI